MSTRKEQIEAMLQDDPNDAFLRYGLAMEFVSAGDDAEAVRHFGQLRSIDPDYVAAYLQEAQSLIRLGRAEAAAAILRSGVGVARKVGNAHAAEEMTGLLEGMRDEG